jgi:SET domain-containing protein
MALLEKHLEVKPSTLPNAGNGLFTTVFIPKGTRIVEYKGRITTWNDVKDDHENGYIYTVNNNHVIDAKKTLRALARYANDARGISRIKGLINNCDYVNEGLRAFIESKKDIQPGEEILVSYGNEYWQVIRTNIKEEQKRVKQEAAGKKAAVKKTVSKSKASPKKGRK